MGSATVTPIHSGTAVSSGQQSLHRADDSCCFRTASRVILRQSFLGGSATVSLAPLCCTGLITYRTDLSF